MADPNEVQRDLLMLEAELKKLEAEYNMFFAGRLPRPPLETRHRVEALIRRWDRGYIEASIDRFRFGTLQARFAKFADLWDRGLRAREEGRPGPFNPPKPPKPEEKPKEKPKEKDAKETTKVLHVTSFTDPMKEMDKLHALYDSLMDARREIGDEVVAFHKFTALVKEQVKQLREKGSGEVAFRVAMKEGKVTFTARGSKGK